MSRRSATHAPYTDALPLSPTWITYASFLGNVSVLKGHDQRFSGSSRSARSELAPLGGSEINRALDMQDRSNDKSQHQEQAKDQV